MVLSDESEESGLVDAIETLTTEVSSLDSSTTGLRNALAMIHSQTLLSLARNIDGLKGQIRSLREDIKELIRVLQYDIRMRSLKK